MPVFSKGFHSLACERAIILLKLAQMCKIFHRPADSLFLISRHTSLNWTGAEAEGQVGAVLQTLIREITASPAPGQVTQAACNSVAAIPLSTRTLG